MTPLKWILLLLGVAGIALYVAWWYRTREEPVAGRVPAAVLRALALALIWLILLNPVWPTAAVGGGRGTVVLLDASLSMSRTASAGGGTLWELAVDSVKGFERVWLFGDEVPLAVSVDSLPDAPRFHSSLLGPALRAVGLSGVERVIVVTDGGLGDPSTAAEEARRLGLGVSVRSLTPTPGDVAIAARRAPRQAQTGDTVRVELDIVAADPEPDSLDVDVVDEAGRRVAVTRIATPDRGRFARAELSFPVGDDTGFRRYLTRLDGPGADVEPRNDRRVFYIQVTDRPTGPVLISLRPDWEPSFLLGTLERVADSPVRAYVLAADEPLRLRDYRPVAPSRLIASARDAPALVVHGYGADAPGWIRTLVREADRILVFTAGERGFVLPGWGVTVTAPAEGEWYATAVPESPLALELSNVLADALPPLARTREVRADRAWSPLELQRMRRGPARPALLLGTVGDRRWAVATSEGYWRWAFREETGRALYRALWTGSLGWLLAGREGPAYALQPLEHAVAQGEPFRWRVPPGLDSLRVEVRSEEAVEVWRRTATTSDSLGVELPPGLYEYRARAFRDRTTREATGPLEVEPFTAELLPRTPDAPEAIESGLVRSAPRADRERRLATLGWPYLLVIGLLCAEWSVRRLSGLR